jgi:hypothetical protein
MASPSIGLFGKKNGVQWLLKKGYSFIFSALDEDIYLPKSGEDNLYTISTYANGDKVHTAVFTVKDIK